MNYCPECGSEVEFVRFLMDIATRHNYYYCKKCNRTWEETIDGASEETLHISPVEPEEKED